MMLQSGVGLAEQVRTRALPRLLSVRVGRPKVVPGSGPWVTSIFKAAIGGPVMLRRMNIDGDEQADLRVHGGPDKAVCVYSADHYPWWRETLGLPDLAHGGFGENFCVAGQTEAEVCIGDRYDIGEAQVEVSQPRTPCWKLARRWGVRQLPNLVLSSGRTGWYLRVIREGTVVAGLPLERTARPFPQWSIESVLHLAYDRAAQREEVRDLASCPVLAPGWREFLRHRLSRSDEVALRASVEPGSVGRGVKG